MAALAEVFDDGRPPTKQKIEIYRQALNRYEIEEISKAVKILISERKFASFPKPAEIIDCVSGSKEEAALTAWHQVVDAVRRIGPYQSVSFPGITNMVIEEMGGWPATGEWREDELQWKQKEFERLYQALANRECTVRCLPGIHEIGNRAGGFEDQVGVVQIGGVGVRNTKRLEMATA